MAIQVNEEVELRNGGVVISSSTAEMRAPDGSLHLVPVVNSNALARVGQSTGLEENIINGTEQQEENKSVMIKNPLPDIVSSKHDLYNFLANNQIIPGNLRCDNCRNECETRIKNQLTD